MNLYLKEPSIEDKIEVLKMCEEFLNSEDEHLFEGAGRIGNLLDVSYEDWLKMCEKDKTIETTNPEMANATTYILVDNNNHVYGTSQLRHTLKGPLFNIGGNIGYAIRPSERRKGYATIQLRLLLEKARELGIEKALVTCRENNDGSRKTIEKFSVEPDTPTQSRYKGVRELRYWVKTKE